MTKFGAFKLSTISNNWLAVVMAAKIVCFLFKLHEGYFECELSNLSSREVDHMRYIQEVQVIQVIQFM